MRTEPRGYWTRVYERAAKISKDKPELTGDSAYWWARKEIDAEIVAADPQQRLAIDK